MSLSKMHKLTLMRVRDLHKLTLEQRLDFYFTLVEVSGHDPASLPIHFITLPLPDVPRPGRRRKRPSQSKREKA